MAPMSKPRRESRSDLVVAAEGLDAELRTFERLADESLEIPLDSQKHLERAGRALTAVCDAEVRLNGHVAALVQAISAARQRQEHTAALLQERALALKDRAEAFGGLLIAFEEIGPAVAAATADLQRVGDADGPSLPLVRERVLEIVEQAAALEERASEDGFLDVARLAASRREQLLSAIARLDRFAALQG